MKNTKHPGCPKYIPSLPKGHFTMQGLCEANGVNFKTGKGKRCSKLTLVHFIDRELNSRKGLIVRIKDETAEPNHKKGLGRKAYVYTRRPGTGSNASTLRSARKSKVTVHVPGTGVSPETAAYEATKAALSAPVASSAAPVATETAPVVTAPETTAAPVVTAPEASPVTA